MNIIRNINDLKDNFDNINLINKTNYQQTYENLYATHLSNKTAITFIENDMITTFIEKDDKTFECVLNIEPIITTNFEPKNIEKFINNIYVYLNKNLYFPLVYSDSIFYKILNKKLYNYQRLYTSISNYKKIGNNILDRVLSSDKVYFSKRNIKKFESSMYIKYFTKIDVKYLIKKIEIKSWKYEKKQDMITKHHQLLYYNELIKQGVAIIAVSFTKNTNIPIAYRIDANYANKTHVLKNSYNEDYKKYSPGSYMLIYDLFKRYPNREYVDLYGGPGLAKQMIETERVERYDMFYGNKEDIIKIKENRNKWDEKIYNNYLLGNSIKKVFNSKENILVATSCFGLGPVGKLNAIIEFAKDRYNWYASGEEFEIGIFLENIFKDTCFTLDKEKIKRFIEKHKIKYAIVVLKNKMAKILIELGVKVVYVDSLPFMWSNKDAEEGKVPYNVDCYCAQKTIELSVNSQKIFSKVKNLVWVNPIVNQKINLIEQLRNENNSKYILINIGGLHSPNTDGLDYVDVVIKPLIELFNNQKIIITTSSKSKALLEKYLNMYMNVCVKTFEQQEFMKRVANANMFLTSPGLTTILESSSLRDGVVFLPPQNISQFYNVEYGKKVFKNYKEITWGTRKLTLDNLGNILENNEKEVIQKINKEIHNINNEPYLKKYKKYIEKIIKEEYLKNLNLNEKGSNGASEVIENLEKIIKEEK